jgi:hypothetical protein
MNVNSHEGQRHLRSVKRELIERQNAAFLDGVCHALDALRDAEGDEVAERMMARLFVRKDAAA